MDDSEKKDWRTRAHEALSRATAMRDQHAKTGMLEVATYYHALECAISKYQTSSASKTKERKAG